MRGSVMKVDIGMPGQPAIVFRLMHIQIIQNYVQFHLGIMSNQVIHEVQEFSPASA